MKTSTATPTTKATAEEIASAVLEWQRAWARYTAPGPMQFHVDARMRAADARLAALNIEG